MEGATRTNECRVEYLRKRNYFHRAVESFWTTRSLCSALEIKLHLTGLLEDLDKILTLIQITFQIRIAFMFLTCL